jgi:phage shock protein PspC (stress-responsive transcriptional regulator)
VEPPGPKTPMTYCCGTSLIPWRGDQGYTGDLPDVLARAAEPGWGHEHEHGEPRSPAPHRLASGAGSRRMALRRPVRGGVVAGVAAGLARYLGVDVMIIRIAFVVLTVVGGAGIPLYLAGLLLIPGEGSEVSIAGSLAGSLRSRSR